MVDYEDFRRKHGGSDGCELDSRLDQMRSNIHHIVCIFCVENYSINKIKSKQSPNKNPHKKYFNTINKNAEIFEH